MKLRCCSCGQEIEHDPIYSSLTIECPACEVKLLIDGPSPILPAIDSTRQEDEEDTFKSSSAVICRAVLRSGSVIDITHFILYPRSLILSARKYMAEAERQMAGFSSGIGFWGSPTWAIGGALLMGAVESTISKEMYAAGNQILNSALDMKENLLQKGEPFSAHNIMNVDRVDPRQWLAGYTQYSFQEGEDGRQKKKLYKLSAKTRFYAHHGEPFVSVITSDSRRINVLWENLEQYEVRS